MTARGAGALIIGGGVLTGLALAASTRRGSVALNVIDYELRDLMAKEYLTPHFTRQEFERSATAAKYGIANTMGPIELANARQLANLLEQLRTGLGGVPVKITSGFRSREVNARIKGASNSSAHTSASAVDIVVDGMTSEALAAAWLALGLPFGELLWYSSDAHVHVTLPGVGGDGEVGHKIGEASNAIDWVRPRSELWTGPTPNLGAEPDWKWRVVQCVAAEGEQSEPGEVNANTDGQGVSYDLFQWTQASGELGKLLRRAATSFPTQFAAAFGPSWRAMVEACEKGNLGPVDGVVLWRDPWLTRFRKAGPLDWMRAAVRGHALSGFHWKEAMKAAEILGATTERSLAAILDRAVPRPGSVVNSARAVMAEHAAELEAQRVAWFVGEELTHVAERYRPQHTARFKRIVDSTMVSDVAIINWTTGVV